MVRLSSLPIVGLAVSALASGFALARSATGDKVLVVIEPKLNKADYGGFWSSLENRGFELHFKGPKEEQNPLIVHGERQYSHLIMLCPSTTSFSESLKPVNLVKALTEHDVNALFFFNSNISAANRDFAREFDIEFEAAKTSVVDYFNHIDGSSEDILLELADSLDNAVPSTVVSPATAALRSSRPIVYSGVAHSLGQNPLLIPVLHAGSTGFSTELGGALNEAAQKGDDLFGNKQEVLAGPDAGLVTVFQTRNNARIGWVGSDKMIKNEVWDKTVRNARGEEVTTGNAALMTDLTKWNFKETGVIKALKTAHFRSKDGEQRELYTKMDNMTYTIDIAEYATTINGTSTWGPFHADDVEFNFVMLDPHVRTVMREIGPSPENAGSRFQVDFKAPTRHGVFKFIVDYYRPGWTFVSTVDKASVVPLRHDEYPRFIQGAWPFYSGALSVTAIFLLFCAIWIWTWQSEATSKAARPAGKKTE